MMFRVQVPGFRRQVTGFPPEGGPAFGG